MWRRVRSRGWLDILRFLRDREGSRLEISSFPRPPPEGLTYRRLRIGLCARSISARIRSVPDIIKTSSRKMSRSNNKCPYAGGCGLLDFRSPLKPEPAAVRTPRIPSCPLADRTGISQARIVKATLITKTVRKIGKPSVG